MGMEGPRKVAWLLTFSQRRVRRNTGVTEVGLIPPNILPYIFSVNCSKIDVDCFHTFS